MSTATIRDTPRAPCIVTYKLISHFHGYFVMADINKPVRSVTFLSVIDRNVLRWHRLMAHPLRLAYRREQDSA